LIIIIIIKALKETQSTEPNQWPGLVLSYLLPDFWRRSNEHCLFTPAVWPHYHIKIWNYV